MYRTVEEAVATHSSIVKPVRWREALLSLCPFVVALALTRLAGLTHPTSTLVALGAYLAYRIAVRFVLCRDHRRGVALARAGRFHEALAAFERSERVWARRRTLDRFRAVLLGSGTPWPFEILARYNQAYALSRLGRGEEALALLTAVLEEDPSMYLARELRDVLLAGSSLHREVGETMR